MLHDMHIHMCVNTLYSVLNDHGRRQLPLANSNQDNRTTGIWIDDRLLLQTRPSQVIHACMSTAEVLCHCEH